MRLLIITQSVDRADPVCGFFHHWIEECAARFTRIEVICLKEGVHALPSNVRVRSLGKEQGRASRATYAYRFFRHLRDLRGTYDAVLVHQNQEYVLLAGLMWRMRGVPVYLWRNHFAGSVLTALAARLSRKVFYTSKASYTAACANGVMMPVGIDIERFKKTRAAQPRSILSLGRIAPSKRIELLIDALKELRVRDTSYSCDIYGDALPKDVGYMIQIREAAKGLNVTFHSGVQNSKTPDIYGAHEVFVNCAPSGMYDKTILEAAACECLVLAASDDWHASAGDSFHIRGDMAQKLAALLALSPEARSAEGARMRRIAASHSLTRLGERLAEEIRM